MLNERPRDGWRETIEQGIRAARGYRRLTGGQGTQEERVSALRRALDEADAVVIGAGAGLSTAAGFTYSGERFERYFGDFACAFGIADIYSGGFYPFPDNETRWAWWARHIYYNRYVPAPKPTYARLLALVEDKDYFVVTTNVDHQFQLAGFDKARLFYTQGDYGLFQCEDGHINETFNNETWVMRAMEAQGFVRDENGIFQVPENDGLAMRLPAGFVPTCPVDGSPVVMNLRADDSFVEDDGWRRASAAYAAFLDAHEQGRVLYLELGVGANTPVIVKYPFWQMTQANSEATYACINLGEAFCPNEIASRSVCIDADIAGVLDDLLEARHDCEA
ncbi:MAG: Sir2 silent information regulator family NAD-dependent deacetylase [Coriobacteriales bacterium]|nr:Sir2 silent information regulator family NAD-dependent deacetylase [Coriobacteriales bacterium]